MVVSAIRCKLCGDVVYSRARHDFRECTCGSSFIDGGREYLRYGGSVEEIVQIDLGETVTEAKLYEDYNTYKDKYGIIRDESN